MQTNHTGHEVEQASSLMSALIWLAQFLVAIPFLGIGIMKLGLSMPELGRAVPWAGEYPVMVRVMGAIDLIGGIGIILPAPTRIKPLLAVWAAIGCSALMICAAVFHLARGEASAIPLNIILLGLCLFVWLGRSKLAPIKPRYDKKRFEIII